MGKVVYEQESPTDMSAVSKCGEEISEAPLGPAFCEESLKHMD